MARFVVVLSPFRSLVFPFVAFSVVFLLVSSLALAQNPGIPDFASIHSDAIDNVKIDDGGILISIPIRNKSALLPMSLTLQTNVGVIGGYNSNQQVDGILVSQTQFTTPGHLYPAINGSSGFEALSGGITDVTCPGGLHGQLYSNFTYTDGTGVQHSVGGAPGGGHGIWTYSPASCGSSAYSDWTSDGLYYITALSAGVDPPYTASDISGATPFADTNGNSLTASGSSNGNTYTITWTDSTGTTPITEVQVTAVVNSVKHFVSDTFTWTDENSNPQSYAVNYSPYTQKTNFGCANWPDITPVTQYYPSSIVAPDGTYNIYYEATPGTPADTTGRISKITFPAGASIQYGYSGGSNGLTCLVTCSPISAHG